MRKYHVQDDYFSVWSTEMAYVLGFISADGYTKNGSQICCKLNIQDRQHLENVLRMMSADYPVHERHYSDNHYCDFQMWSKRMHSDLEALGVTEKKSLTHECPQIPIEHRASFVRGYFDGDGGIQRESNTKSPNDHLQLSIIGTLNLVTHISEFFQEHYGCKVGCVRSRGTSSYVSYHGTKSSLAFCEWMYGNSTPETRLARKYDKFCQYKAEFGHLATEGVGHRGEKHHFAVLNWNIIREIRASFLESPRPQSKMCLEYDISQSHLSGILRNKYWRDALYDMSHLAELSTCKSSELPGLKK